MASLKCKEVLCHLYSALLFISGLLLIIFSVVLSYRLFYHFSFVPGGSIGPFIVIFILGFIHLILTWLGVKGPSREHDFHIILFMVLTLVLLVVECAVGVWAIVLWDEVDVKSDHLMHESFSELLAHDYNKKKWESLERNLHCCGYDSVKEYIDVKKYTPNSCCEKPPSNTDNNVTTSITCKIYEVGCKFPLMRYVKSLMIDAAIMAFCCSIMQAFGIFLFYKFFSDLRRERSERYQHRLANQRNIAEQPHYVVPVLPVSATSGGSATEEPQPPPKPQPLPSPAESTPPVSA